MSCTFLKMLLAKKKTKEFEPITLNFYNDQKTFLFFSISIDLNRNRFSSINSDVILRLPRWQFPKGNEAPATIEPVPLSTWVVDIVLPTRFRLYFLLTLTRLPLLRVSFSFCYFLISYSRRRCLLLLSLSSFWQLERKKKFPWQRLPRFVLPKLFFNH